MARTAYLAILAISVVVTTVYIVAVLVTFAVGLPWDIGLPPWVRVAGALLIPVGLAMIAWVFRFRGWSPVLESTYLTLVKLARRAPVDAPLGRTEPLVVAGPYRLVRHPLYSGVVIMTIGIALAADRTTAFLGAAFLFVWLRLVVTPFEERELVALFGPAYTEYARRTPALLPIPKR